MTEKSLLSIREIARELNLNYRIMLNYKNQIQNLLPEKTDGQFSKYPAECVDLFRLVSALRDEGFTFEMIRTALSGKDSPADDIEINEWISSWAGKLKRSGTDQSREIHTDLNQRGLTQSSSDISGSTQSNPEQSGLIQSIGELSEQAEINPEQSKEVYSNPDVSALIQSISHLQTQITDLATSQPPDLMAQLNASLTQFYKFCQSIAERMDRLESELGIEHAEQVELDLESLQVDHAPSYEYADLEFVRNSITNGKPDKDAVRQWLLNERQQSPETSYAILAEMLNQRGGPHCSDRK